jgi:serine/threonine protein kinase
MNEVLVLIGQVLGHCRVIAQIGEGGMGVVYRAYDEVLHRDVAVKVVKKSATPDISSRQNLLQEARASSSLAHPNICTIYDVGEIGGDLYIVMELVEGKSLHGLAGEMGLPPETVLRYGVQIASALARAHDRGIVHRDLKTANIVVTPEGLVKVLDFGLAKRVGGGILDAPTLSFSTVQDGSSMSGTLPYMAPEVLRGDAADSRSDLWALGVVLYEAASGRLPFGGRTGFEISAAIMREIPSPLGPPVPPGLWAIIQRCLAKEPMQRYQRATEVQAALEAVQSGGIAFPEAAEDRTAGPPRTTTMHSIRHVRIKKRDFVVLVGTNKGAFILRSNAQRRRWDVGGPYFHGHSVYAMAYDGRGDQRRIWASTSSFWGTLLRSSDDFGKSWTNPQQAPVRFPADTGTSLKNIWQITLGRAEEPDRLYCGVEPAALFESRTQARTGRWCVDSSIIRIAPAGCRAMAASLCIRLCSTHRISRECMLASRPEASTAPKMADRAGRRRTAAFAPCSCRRNIRSSGNASTRLLCIPPARSVCSCRIIGDFIAPMTVESIGPTSPTECPRISVSLL